MTSSHPYYPTDAILSGTFIPNHRSVPHLITTFAAGWAVILGLTLLTVRRVNPKLSVSDQALVLWFVLSENTHPSFLRSSFGTS